MRFGLLALAEAEGAVLAHGNRLFRKGRVLSAADLRALAEAGIAEVMAARLEPGDVAEDRAAERLAERLLGEGVAAGAAARGRVNLHATAGGLLTFDAGALAALNAVNEGLTLATLNPFSVVAAGDLVATVKIIPFALGEEVVSRGEQAARPLAVRPFSRLRVGLVITETGHGKAGLAAKAEAATAARVQALGGHIATLRRVAHEARSVAAAVAEVAGHELVLVAGEAAIVDRADVVPAGIVAAGGRILQLGMPVDPGNLLLLAELRGTPVIGVPSCARSPQRNGFDLVLERVMAGVSVGPLDLTAMGVGGLLSEIASRPSPRQPRRRRAAPRAAAIILAAGLSRRMGRNKLLMPVDGVAMIRRVAEKVVALGLGDVIVVTGHDAAGVAAALAGVPVRLVHNADYEQGLASSLRAGVAALPPGAQSALICLGDMPQVSTDDMMRLICAGAGGRVAVPVRGGRRGNPVLWPRAHFTALKTLSGDQGARGLLGGLADVVEVAAENDGIFADFDTPEDLRSGPATGN